MARLFWGFVAPALGVISEPNENKIVEELIWREKLLLLGGLPVV